METQEVRRLSRLRSHEPSTVGPRKICESARQHVLRMWSFHSLDRSSTNAREESGGAFLPRSGTREGGPRRTPHKEDQEVLREQPRLLAEDFLTMVVDKRLFLDAERHTQAVRLSRRWAHAEQERVRTLLQRTSECNRIAVRSHRAGAAPGAAPAPLLRRSRRCAARAPLLRRAPLDAPLDAPLLRRSGRRRGHGRGHGRGQKARGSGGPGHSNAGHRPAQMSARARAAGADHPPRSSYSVSFGPMSSNVFDISAMGSFLGSALGVSFRAVLLS